MHLVALLRVPDDQPAAARLLVEAAGLTHAEANMRLAAEPPALIARLPAAEASALVGRLRDQGFTALAIPQEVPGDAQRTVGHTLKLDDRALTVTPRSGPPRVMEWDRISVVLRATSAVRTRSEVTETRREGSPGLALVTGGMVMSKTVTTTQQRTTSEKEQSIYVYAADGGRAVLREQALNFQCLGKAMQPVRAANMAVLAGMLRDRAGQASYDERLLRIGTRQLPFITAGDTSFNLSAAGVQRTSTAPAVDVLAEFLRRGFEEGWI